MDPETLRRIERLEKLLALLQSGGGGSSTPGAGSVVQFVVGTTTARSLTAIPAGAVITDVNLFVTTLYSTDTIAIGSTGSPNLLVTPGQFPLSFAIPYDTGQINAAWPGGVVVATIAGSDVVGACVVRVWFSTPAP